MQLNEYQRQAKTTAIYPIDNGIMYCTLGLVGESGKIAQKLKKVIRGDCYFLHRSDLALELGDVLWYVSQLASELGYDLNAIAEINLVKLREREQRNTLNGNGDFKMTEEKARRILVPFGDILLNGFVLPDGSYALSQSQVAEAVKVHKFLVSRFLTPKTTEPLLDKDFRRHTFEVEVERDSLTRGGANTVKIIPIRLASAFWLEQACKGNVKAQALSAACMAEALERRFDKIVAIERVEEFYNERLTSSRQWFQSRQFEYDMHSLFQNKCIIIGVHAGVAHNMLTVAITGCTAEEHRMLEFVEGDRPSVRQKSLIQKSKVQKRYKPLDCRASLATLRDLFMENEKYVFREECNQVILRPYYKPRPPRIANGASRFIYGVLTFDF